MDNDSLEGDYRVSPALLSDARPIAAVVVEKRTATDCTIQFVGSEVRGLYTNLEPGQRYFLSESAHPSLSTPFPDLDTPKVYVKSVGIALAPNVLSFRPGDVLTARVL